MATFLEDLKRKKLIPVKILAFCIYGGQATLYPFLGLHLFTLGLDLKTLVAIFASQPLIALIVAPCVSVVATRLTNVRGLFVFFLVFSAVAVNCLQLVPNVEYITEGEVKLRLSCGPSRRNKTILNFLIKESCQGERQPAVSPDLVQISSSLQRLDFFVSDCILKCPDDRSTLPRNQFCFFKQGNEQADCNQKPEHDRIMLRALKLTNWTIQNETSLSHEISSFENEGEVFDKMTCDRDLSVYRCHTICNATVEDNGEICKNLIAKPYSGGSVTFWQYLGVRSLVSFSIGMVNGLFDASTAYIVSEQESEFKRQRVWSMIGACVMAPVAGIIVGRKQILETQTPRKTLFPQGDYNLCFYLSGALYLASAVTTSLMELNVKSPNVNAAFSLVRNLLRDVEIVQLLVGMGLLGTCWGLLENFFFHYLDTSFTTHTLVLGGIVAITALTVSQIGPMCTSLIELIRPVNVISVCFVIYATRFFTYYYIPEPYWCLLLEAVGAFSLALVIVGVTLYCTRLVPLPMLATIMMLCNALHFVIGRSLGALIGGLLVAYYGYRNTFFVFGCACGALAIIYFMIMITVTLRKKNKLMRALNDTIPEIRHIRSKAGDVSSLLLSYNESSGFSVFAVSSILSPKLSASENGRLGEVRLRPMRHSIPSGDGKPKATSSRKNSLVANYRSSLAPVPEENLGHDSPTLNQKTIGRFLITLGDRGEPEGCENKAFEEDPEIVVGGKPEMVEAEINCADGR